jgi:hypothetical protein
MVNVQADAQGQKFDYAGSSYLVLRNTVLFVSGHKRLKGHAGDQRLPPSTINKEK